MKLHLMLAAALLATVLGMPHAAAVIGGPGPTLGILDVGGILYVVDEGYVLGNGLWIYEESNGIAGLQRGGCSSIVPGDCDATGDGSDARPDTLIV